jgi:hypothetical protein
MRGDGNQENIIHGTHPNPIVTTIKYRLDICVMMMMKRTILRYRRLYIEEIDQVTALNGRCRDTVTAMVGSMRHASHIA